MTERSREQLRTSSYRPDVDGLRAVAILSVLFFHAFPSIVPGGFVGVDVFFVISGYLITGIIVRGLSAGRFSFATFYANRVRRIFPALTLILASTYIAGWWLLLLPEFSELGKHIAGGIGFVQNIVLWSEAGYFDTASESKPLLHLWSLGIEEQFYLFFPLILWLASRSRVISSLAVVLCVTVICMALNVANIKQYAAAVYFLPYYRFWELTIGGIVAHAGSMRVPRSFLEATAIVGLGMIVAAAFGFNRTTPFPGWLALLPVSGAAFLILAGPDAWINRRILAQRVIVGIGLISYPLYLWHWPLLTFLRIVEPTAPSRSVRAAAVVISVALAWLTYRLVEQPVRSGEKSSLKVTALAMAGVVIGLVGLETYREDGVPSRFPSGVRELVAYKFDPTTSYRLGVCYLTSHPGQIFQPSDFSPSCGESEPGKPSLLLWGDSFSASLYAGVKAAFPERSVLQFSESLCPPIFNLAEGTFKDCPAINAFVYGTITAHPPNKVLLAANWKTHDWKRVGQTIMALHEIGIRDVVIIGPLPQWGRRLPDIMARQALRHAVAAPPVRLIDESLDAQLRFDAEMRQFALKSGADYVSPVRLLCDSEHGCLVRDASGPAPFTPLAFDNAHLTDIGTRLLGRLMRDRPTASGETL